MTLTEAMLALVKDHCYGRHHPAHPQCPVCLQQRPIPGIPEWVRRKDRGELPPKVLLGSAL